MSSYSKRFSLSLIEVTANRKSGSLFPLKIMKENIIHTIHSLLCFYVSIFHRIYKIFKGRKKIIGHLLYNKYKNNEMFTCVLKLVFHMRFSLSRFMGIELAWSVEICVGIRKSNEAELLCVADLHMSQLIILILYQSMSLN